MIFNTKYSSIDAKEDKFMNKIVEELKKVKVFYIATIDGDKPRVRPFGTIAEVNGDAYICCGNFKDVYKQIIANPNVELCAFKDGKWIRVRGKLVLDDRFEAKKNMLDKNPGLRGMYSENDGNTEVYYFDGGEAIFSEFGKESRTVKF